MLHKTRVAIRFGAKKPLPQPTRNLALVCLWAVYIHVIEKFSRTGSLQHFLTQLGALLRERELRYK